MIHTRTFMWRVLSPSPLTSSPTPPMVQELFAGCASDAVAGMDIAHGESGCCPLGKDVLPCRIKLEHIKFLWICCFEFVGVCCGMCSNCAFHFSWILNRCPIASIQNESNDRTINQHQFNHKLQVINHDISILLDFSCWQPRHCIQQPR